MKTIQIGNQSYQAEVERIHYAPDWPGADRLGDIGGYVKLEQGFLVWVLSKDNKRFVPCPGHEQLLKDFLEKGISHE